jgi:hypothetical protein
MLFRITALLFLLIFYTDVLAQPLSAIETQHNSIIQLTNDICWKNQSLFPGYKYQPLSQIDSSDYRLIDSLDNARILGERLKLMDALISGNTPVGIFNLDYKKLINYNEFEGIRIGIGLATNKKISSHFSLGGYITYGFNDHAIKYGASIQLFPYWSSVTKLIFQYHNDVSEVGGYHFLDEYIFNQSEIFRNLDIDRMLYIHEFETDLSFKALKYFKINFYANITDKILPGYIFTPAAADYNGYESTFHFTEIGMNMKIAFYEKFITSPGGRLIATENNYPDIWLNIRKGIPLAGSDFNYTKYELKVMQIIPAFLFGQSKFVFVAGKIYGDIPITDLYNGHASYAPVTIDAENTFATMRMDEFYTSGFTSLFFRQKFRPLFNYPFFHPNFTLAANAGFGQLSNAGHHAPVILSTFNHGYYESGILINNLLISGSLINLGFGVFYRYGPYSFSNISDNFSYRVTLDFNLK